MRKLSPALPALAATLLSVATARAGGGPMNVMVLYSGDDAQATAVAKHYQKARSLPPGHLCALPGITPMQTQIDVPTYESLIHVPFDACLARLPQPDEIDYLVLVRGLPYQVNLPSYTASLQAVLQVHRAKQISTGMQLAGQGQPMSSAAVPNPAYPLNAFPMPGDFTVMNQYSGWYVASTGIVRAAEQPRGFKRATAADAGDYHFAGNLFIVQALDGFDYADATALVDRGVAADGTFPTAELLCMRGEDDPREARDPECEFTTRMLTAAGFAGKFVDPFDAKLTGHDVMAYFTGSAGSEQTAIAGNTYAPGAITCNLTSFGAAISNFFCSADGKTCPASESQTSIARFIRAGASGAHGTVNEPLNNVFPNAGAYLHYTFGYSMGESYFFNQRFLYWQNIYLGDPLASPYAHRPKVSIAGGDRHPAGSPLVIDATHPDGVAHLDLYVGGKRVASADKDTLSYDAPDPVGAKLDVLAVAVAKNAPVMRTGWPQPAQKPRADVQGWLGTTVTITAELPDGGGAGGGGGSGAGAGAGSTTGATGAGGAGAGTAGTGGSGAAAAGTPGKSGGCGCRTAEPAPAVPVAVPLLGLVAALAAARRRLDRRPRAGGP